MKTAHRPSLEIAKLLFQKKKTKKTWKNRTAVLEIILVQAMLTLLPSLIFAQNVASCATYGGTQGEQYEVYLPDKYAA